MTSFAEVIGDPVDHLKSPLVHRFWLNLLGLKNEFRTTRIDRSELAAYVAARRPDPEWRGCNVTMPLRLDALLMAEEKSDAAVQAGACNLLLPRDGRLLAANTDIGGMMTVIARLADKRPTRSVTVLGSGGAARSLLVALKRMGMSNVLIQGEKQDEAKALAIQFGLKFRPEPFGAPLRTDALINATPLGMDGTLPLDVDLTPLPASGWVLDLVTSPSPSELVTRAASRGLATSSGLAVLVEQATATFPLLFGLDAPRNRENDARLFERLDQ